MKQAFSKTCQTLIDERKKSKQTISIIDNTSETESSIESETDNDTQADVSELDKEMIKPTQEKTDNDGNDYKQLYADVIKKYNILEKEHLQTQSILMCTEKEIMFLRDIVKNLTSK
jgi:hypothetical protein